MNWQLSEEQAKAYKSIEAEQKKYGEKVAKIILSLPPDLQQGGMFCAIDCGLEVLSELMFQSPKGGK